VLVVVWESSVIFLPPARLRDFEEKPRRVVFLFWFFLFIFFLRVERKKEKSAYWQVRFLPSHSFPPSPHVVLRERKVKKRENFFFSICPWDRSISLEKSAIQPFNFRSHPQKLFTFFSLSLSLTAAAAGFSPLWTYVRTRPKNHPSVYYLLPDHLVLVVSRWWLDAGWMTRTPRHLIPIFKWAKRK
jgi:hypothetical protein